jgi:hypothetical protein
MASEHKRLSASLSVRCPPADPALSADNHRTAGPR